MLTNLSNLSKSAIYYGLAVGLCLVVALLYPILGEAVIAVAMLTPLAATLLMLLVVTPDGRTKAGWASLGLHRLGLKAWPIALLVPLVVLGGAYGLVWATGLAGFSLTGELANTAVWMLPVLTIIIIGKHLLTGALGEEIGWRGYLLPHLARAIGRRWALPLSGLLHGLWHLPVILCTPLYHSGADLLLVLPLFLVGATVSGMVVGHLRLMTGSVWPSAIMHAAMNVFWAVFRMSTLAAPPLVTEYLVGESGLLPLAGYTAVVVTILLMARNTRRQPKLAAA